MSENVKNPPRSEMMRRLSAAGSRPAPVISISASDRENTVIDIPVKKEVKKKKKVVDREKRRLAVQNSIAAANVFLVGGVLVFGSCYMLFFRHETVAHDENRNLARFPEFSLSSYISGEYTEGIAEYFDDTIHGRAYIKEFIADKLMPLKGRPYGGGDGVELYGSAYEHEKKSDEEEVPATTEAAVTTEAVKAETTVPVTTEQPVTTQPATEKKDTNGELTNNILVINKRGITLYGGGEGRELEYASCLNAYKKALPDVNVYSMVLPTSCSFYLPEKYRHLAASEKDDFDRIAGALEDVVPVDAYSALEAHTDEDIYSRTDHHWQALGAYYAAQEFAKNAGVPFADISSYDKVVLEDYVGTLYGYTQSSVLLNSPEEFVYYKPRVKTETEQYDTYFQNPKEAPLLLDPEPMATSSYYMVFGSDDRIAHVRTECKNGRTLVIFKDSYGNALLPFLTSSFEDIYLCDIRYFDINAAQFVRNVKATDLLFAMCSYSAVGGNRLDISSNLYK